MMYLPPWLGGEGPVLDSHARRHRSRGRQSRGQTAKKCARSDRRRSIEKKTRKAQRRRE